MKQSFSERLPKETFGTSKIPFLKMTQASPLVP